MKKVFVPNRIELERMREYGANIYKYLLVKAIESVIVYGLENPKNDSILESAYKDVRNNFHIVDAICHLYPEEVLHSNMAADSVSLCLDLLEGENKNNSLDMLSYFTSDVLSNGLVMQKAIMLLEEDLKKNPRYRFEYNDNVLVNKILNGSLSEREFDFILTNKMETFKALCNIEPYYVYTFGNKLFNSKFEINMAINVGINNYAKRYGIHNDAFDYYEGEDVFKENILNFDGIKLNPYEEAKPLIKCIKRMK